MKTFVLVELLLLSKVEKKALRIKFDPQCTTIVGANDTGKSSILKSIYYTLGAEVGFTSAWVELCIYSMVKILIEDRSYTILRRGRLFVVSDDLGNVTVFRGVSQAFGPYLAGLFEFGLLLEDHGGSLVTPPPAFMFIPFYFDQDAGWTKRWESFERLGQFSSWKADAMNYFSGITDDSYYKAKQRRLEFSSQRTKVQEKKKPLKQMHSHLESKIDAPIFDVDIKSFQAEVDKLIVCSNELRKREESYKSQLYNLRDMKKMLEMQWDVARHVREEVHADLEYAAGLDSEVKCPTCGVMHTNSFAERFEIASDEGSMSSVMMAIVDELAEIDRKIEENAEEFRKAHIEFDQVSSLLAQKRGDIALADIIKTEGRKELYRLFEDESHALEREIDQLSGFVKQYEKIMHDIVANAKVTVMDFYEETLRRYISELNIHNFSPRVFTNLNAKSAIGGSNTPRMLLAQNFAFYQLVQLKHGMCPIVIDSPNQQDQDQENHERILKFIKTNRPKSQLILGMVDSMKIDFGGAVVALDNPRHVLGYDHYDAVLLEMNPLIELALGSLIDE